MTKGHIHSLIHRRARIQREIDAEQARAGPQWLRIARLKKIRLHLKDRLVRLTAEMSRAIDGPRSATVGERRRRLRTHSR